MAAVNAQTLPPITDRAAIEAAFAADQEAEDALPHRFLPTTPDDGDEGGVD